jgi:hypothetical protein
MAVWRYPVEVAFAGAGAPGVNVFTIRAEDTADEAGVTAAAAALRAFYIGVQSVLPTSTIIRFPNEAVNRQSEEALQIAAPAQVVGAGGAGGPDVLQACIAWKTSLRARRGTGRTFIGPLAEGYVGPEGAPTTAGADAIEFAAQDLVDVSTAANGWAIAIWGQVALLKEASPEQRAAAPKVARDITGYSFRRAKLAVLRSRRD